MYKDITAILLAGGKSSRMGVNKSFLKYKGKYVVEHVFDKLKNMFGRNIVISNSPEEYAFLGADIFCDIYKENGPLGGIHSGLFNSQTEINFIISCDVPLISKRLIDFIVNNSRSEQITIINADGYIQKLIGVYKKSCLPIIESILNNEENSGCKVSELVNKVSSRIIDETEIPFDIKGQCLNMNSPNDFKKLSLTY